MSGRSRGRAGTPRRRGRRPYRTARKSGSMSENFTVRTEDVFLVVDIQNDFCPGGGLVVPRGDEVVPLINGLADKFAHVVLTQDWHPRGHLSFASSHAGKQAFQTIEVAYGTQV